MKDQKCTPRGKRRNTIALLVTLLFMLSFMANSQDQEPVYTITSLMKVEQGNGGKYVQVEKEFWKPMHQELVKQGKILGWYLYRVQYTGSGDEYNYATVTHYQGSDNFTLAYQDVASKVHPSKKVEEMFKETMESRDLVTSKLLRWQLQSLPEGQQEPSKLVVVNYLKVSPWNEFYNLRRDYVKPAFDHLVKEGKSAGWGMWRTVFPSGADEPYDAVSADFYNKFDQIGTNGLFPLIRELNSDKDMDEVMKNMNENRRFVKRELWQLIDYVR